MLLIRDEMHIREDLVYDKQTGIIISLHKPPKLLLLRNIPVHVGALTGITNLGEINNHLVAYEGQVAEDRVEERC